MQDHELDGYLGDFPATDEQRLALHRASDLVDTRYAGADGEAAKTAFTAAYQIIVGDYTLDDLTETWRTARLAERAAMGSLTGALIAASITTSENALSETTGLNRRTVRKALGK